MKKSIISVAAVVMAIMVMAGCSAKKSFDASNFVTEVMANVSYDDEMIQVPEKTAQTLYNLGFDGLESYTLYTSATSATANELMVMKVKDSAAEAKAKEAIETRKKDLIALYESYRPDEMKKLNDVLLITEGGYVIFSVSNDNAKVEEYIASNTK